MAKYFATQNTLALNTQKAAAWKWNSELVSGVENRFETKVPESVVEMIKNVDVRLAKIILVTFEDFDARFPDETTSSNNAIRIGEKDTKTGMPYLYVYAPEMEFAVIKVAEKAAQKRMDSAWKHNEPLLNAMAKRFELTNIPESLLEKVKNLEKEVDKIILLTFDEFIARFDGTSSETCLAIANEDITPLLYVYTPELADKAQQIVNMKRISSLLQKRHDLKPSKQFLTFVSNELPADIPFQTQFDGSRNRVIALANKPDAKVYGDVDGEIFAVEYIWRENATITIFVGELDYKSILADNLVRIAGIPHEVASQISDALPHDTYYGIHDQAFTDFESYVIKMAYLLKVNEGDVVHDLLQGNVEAGIAPYSKKMALNLDDEFPSALLIGNRINVFLPGNMSTT